MPFCSYYFLADQDAFYIVSGGDTAIKSLHLIGNIPKMLASQAFWGLAVGFVCLIVVALILHKSEKARQSGRLSARQLTTIKCFLPLVFFGLWELSLHCPGLTPHRNFIADPITFWKANPQIASLPGRHAGLVGVDRQRIAGIFDQDHLEPKPKGTFRIVFLGDSQAISANKRQYAKDICYPKVLEKNLIAQGYTAPNNKSLQVIDGAISGYTSWQGLLLLKSDILPLQPDLIIEAFGYHDSNEAFSTDRQVMTDNVWLHRLRKVMYRSHICLLIRSLWLRNNSSRYSRYDIDATERVPLPDFRENLSNFLTLAKNNQAKIIFLIEPINHNHAHLKAQLAPYDQAVKEIAASTGTPVIDAKQAFENLPEEQYRCMFIDAIHFSEAGHAYMAEFVESQLLRLKYINVYN